MVRRREAPSRTMQARLGRDPSRRAARSSGRGSGSGARRHSARTSSSASAPTAFATSASNCSRSTNCDSAQTAAPRTSGLASSSRRSASAASDASSELPIAISTLRTKRSRPMRLTGDFENSARNAASSSRASSASDGARNSRARQVSLRGRPARTCSTGRRRGSRRSHRCGCRCLAELVRDRPLVLDGQVGNAAPRIELVGRGEGVGRADVEAGAAGAAMIGVGVVARQLGRGEDRAEEQPGAEFARDQIGVLALPAQPAACASGFSITARCRRRPSRRRRMPRPAIAPAPSAAP